jgi:hypothetical protein
MNFTHLAIPYFSVPPSILRLNSKLAILSAIAIYRDGLPGLEKLFDSKYRKRQRSDVEHSLVNNRVLTEEMEPLSMERDEVLRPDCIQLPARFDYGSLSLSALKVFIAAEKMGRYKRESFQFLCTQTEFMDTANIGSKTHLVAAVKELETERLIKVKHEHKKPSTYTLLDPEGSGVPRFFMARYIREKWNALEVSERYTHLFGETVTEQFSDYVMDCPFCFKKKKMRIGTMNKDWYKCHSCGAHGDTEKLYIKFVYGNRNEWARTLMPTAINPATDEIGEGA